MTISRSTHLLHSNTTLHTILCILLTRFGFFSFGTSWAFNMRSRSRYSDAPLPSLVFKLTVIECRSLYPPKILQTFSRIFEHLLLSHLIDSLFETGSTFLGRLIGLLMSNSYCDQLFSPHIPKFAFTSIPLLLYILIATFEVIFYGSQIILKDQEVFLFYSQQFGQLQKPISLFSVMHVYPAWLSGCHIYAKPSWLKHLHHLCLLMIQFFGLKL